MTALKDELPHNSIDVSYFLMYIQLLLMFSVVTVLYCFLESWIYSVHADEVVTACSSTRKQEERQAKNAIAETNTELEDTNGNLTALFGISSDSNKETEKRHTVTWRKLLRWIDITLVLISVCVVSISTTVFFYYLSRRSTI